jgi:hypothetical protein
MDASRQKSALSRVQGWRFFRRGQTKKYYPSLYCADRRSGSQGDNVYIFVLLAHRCAGKEKKDLINNTTNAYQHNTIAPNFPPIKIVERKIGRSTFIVSSRFNGNKQKDIVSTVARLVQYDNENGKGERTTSGQIGPKSRIE